MITLGVPYEAVTLSIELKDPELGDGQNLDIKTNFKKAMSGHIYSTIKTPGTTILNWTFVNLSRNKTIELEDFLIFAAGKNIDIVDHDSTHWKCKLLSPLNEFVTTGRGTGYHERRESNSINLQFEAVEV